MTNTICRFLATPSPVFDLQTEKRKESVSVQQFAIVRLAQCVQVSFLLCVHARCARPPNLLHRPNLMLKWPRLPSLPSTLF